MVVQALYGEFVYVRPRIVSVPDSEARIIRKPEQVAEMEDYVSSETFLTSFLLMRNSSRTVNLLNAKSAKGTISRFLT